MTAASTAAARRAPAARRTPRAAAPRTGRVAKPACGAARRKSRGVARAALTAAHADTGGEAVFTSLRLNSPGRAARVAATAAVFSSINAQAPGRFRRGAVCVDALAVLPSDSPPTGADASSWKLVPALSPRGRSPRSPSVAALLTSPGGTTTRRSLSPTRLDTPFVPPTFTPPKSSWAKPGGPLERAANDWPRAAAGGGGGGGGRRGGGRGGGRGGRGGNGGGNTPTRRGTPPSPGPNRGTGASARGRHLGIAVLAAATRLRRAPVAGFSLLRRAVASCAAVVRGASSALAPASAAAVAVPPLMFAAAPGFLVGASPANEAAAPMQDTALAFPRTYEVREGDTLWAIALNAYGDGSRYADILAANPGLAEALSETGSGLDAGAQLRLPPP